ncbi:hypothetical protein [Sorangium sp. So ce1151]|uniref:hypothetical protein n=1 Tax=Sorangium sp. So ce1151 TaxID=3133332 RepID=UPI003F5F67C7
MVKQDGEAPGVPRAIQSQGEDAARAYAVGEVAPRPLSPTLEMERVHIEDPRRVPPPLADARRGSGARNPAQRAPLADVGAPSVSMPEGLPVTKRQPIVIDSELLAEWHGGRAGAEGEGGERAGGGERGGAAGSDAMSSDAPAAIALAGSAGGAGRAPRLAEVAAARRSARRAGWQRAVWVVAMGVLLAIGLVLVRSGRGARDGAGEVVRGAGGAVRGVAVAAFRRAKGTAAESAGAPVASAATAGAAVAARPMPRVEPPAAAMTLQESRRGAPAASQRASPGVSASAAPARDAPKRPAGAAPDALSPPSPYDNPNFD